MILLLLLILSQSLCTLAPKSAVTVAVKELWRLNTPTDGLVICREIPWKARQGALLHGRAFFKKLGSQKFLEKLSFLSEQEREFICSLRGFGCTPTVLLGAEATCILNKPMVWKLFYQPPGKTYLQIKETLERIDPKLKTEFLALKNCLSIQNKNFIQAVYCIERMPYLGTDLDFLMSCDVNLKSYFWKNFHYVFVLFLNKMLRFHDQGILHGDPSRANFIYTPKKDEVVLIDWGKAILMSETSYPYQKKATEILKMVLCISPELDYLLNCIYIARACQKDGVPPQYRRIAFPNRDGSCDYVAYRASPFYAYTTDNFFWYLRREESHSDDICKILYHLGANQYGGIAEMIKSHRSGKGPHRTPEEMTKLLIRGAVSTDDDLKGLPVSQKQKILILRFLISYILGDPKYDPQGVMLAEELQKLIWKLSSTYIPSFPYYVPCHGWVYPSYGHCA